MAETTADVRRDIEVTRERMSNTLAQLEQKMNVMAVVKDHPWPALGLAFGAGVLLSGSSTDVRAAAATVAATKGASSRLGPVLDDLVANLVTGVSQAFQTRVDEWVTEIKGAIGAPATTRGVRTPTATSDQYGTQGYAASGQAPQSSPHDTGAPYNQPPSTGTEQSRPENLAQSWRPTRAD